jgi:predicted DsbA family dithiol-disulfide isomerase
MSDHIQAQLSGIRVSTTRVGTLVGAGADPIKFEVFFDYGCPYVYRASLLIDAVRRSGRELDVRWRYFSLTQVNSKDDGWTVWDAPSGELVKGRLAFKAAEAARRQHRFDDLHRALLDARHRERLELDDPEVVESAAAHAGLDVQRLKTDLADPTILDTLAADHRHAVAELGIFGTPTFVFDGGASAYVRLTAPAEVASAGTGLKSGGLKRPSAGTREKIADSSVEVFERLLAVAADEPRILEIKRPRKPVA